MGTGGECRISGHLDWQQCGTGQWHPGADRGHRGDVVGLEHQDQDTAAVGVWPEG